MTFTFRPAVRESVNLLIGLAGGTGSGKSFSALRLATGMAKGEKFAVLDSENRRALHYADQFKFDYAELRAPFRPEAYADAIMAADAAGYPVIVVDQVSYEHAGDGGLLDWQEEELDRMAGQDYKKREACKMASWIKPKMGHKHMMQKLLQVRAHLILCMRAEPKIEMVKGDDGKWKIVPKQSLVGLDGWIPICEKSLPYELTASFLLTADAPGMPKPIKLQAQHRPLFPLDKPITEESGRLIAQWAGGEATVTNTVADAIYKMDNAACITNEQQAYIEVTCQDHGIPVAALKKAAKVEMLSAIRADDYPRVKKWLNNAIAKRKAA